MNKGSALARQKIAIVALFPDAGGANCPYTRLLKPKSEVAMELSDVAAFVKVVQSGSFTQAARVLEVPKSTISAKVAHLEKRLGVTLMHRTTRKLSITEEGDAFFRACARALADIEAAETSLAVSQTSPQGRITVTAPVDVGNFLAQFLVSFLQRYPGIKVDLLLTNRFVDLVGENVDVAIRGGNLKSSSLIAKRIATSQAVLLASPRYLERMPALTHPRDLQQHECLRFASRNEWTLVKEGKSITVTVQGRVSVDELPTLRELAVNGLGIALLPTFLCRGELGEEQLLRVLPEWSGSASSISLVYPAQRHQHPKVKVFVKECAAALQNYFSP